MKYFFLNTVQLVGRKIRLYTKYSCSSFAYINVIFYLLLEYSLHYQTFIHVLLAEISFPLDSTLANTCCDVTYLAADVIL